jgi:hypothetical protein
MGILEYSEPLKKKVDNEILLESGERMEVELRIAAVRAADILMNEINDRRDDNIYAPHLDLKLFEIRDEVETPVHKTVTSDY